MLNSGATKDKYRIENTLKDFNVKSEDEFYQVVDSTWDQSICVKCGNKISLLHCHFDTDDNPVCVEH